MYLTMIRVRKYEEMFGLWKEPSTLLILGDVTVYGYQTRYQ